MSFLFVFVQAAVLALITLGVLLVIWPATRRAKVLLGMVGLAAVIHALWWLVPQLNHVSATIVRWIVAVWISFLLSAAMLAVPFLLVALIKRLTRRASVRWTLGPVYIALCLVAGLIVGSTSVASFKVRHEDVVIAGMPAALDGLRIGNLSDVHIGRFIDVHELDRAVDALNAANVDLVVVAGDLIDDLTQLDATFTALERSRAAQGIVAALGNHEKNENLPLILAAYESHAKRIHLLVDQSMTIERDGAQLRMVGLDYPMDVGGGHLLPKPEQEARMRASATKAFAQVRAGEFVIAVSHHPDVFPITAQHGALLTIAAHTHGGQVALFGHPIISEYDHMHGRYTLGRAQLDVSAGAGHWLPVRFGMPREVVVLTLHAAK